jgi:hypothetical protein
MIKRHQRRAAASVTTLLALFIITASSIGLTSKKADGIVVGPGIPSWVLPGEYVEYIQTYVIDGLAASVNIKETFLNYGNALGMSVQSMNSRVAPGFSMPGLILRNNQSGDGTDPTVFVDSLELANMNASVVSLHIAGPTSPTIQAWKVNETRLNLWIYGMFGESGAIVNSSFVWFEKDLSVKIRESTNYTIPVYGHYIISVEKLEDTNMPQLKPLLMSQGSTNSSRQESTTVSASLATSAATQSTDYPLEGSAVLAAAVVTAMVATGFYFARRKHSADAAPGRTQPQIVISCEMRQDKMSGVVAVHKGPLRLRRGISLTR